jgi:hypothetical protein
MTTYCANGCGTELKEPRNPHDRGLCLRCYKGLPPDTKTDKKDNSGINQKSCPDCGMPMRVIWLKYGAGATSYKVYKWSCDQCQKLFLFER